MKRTGILIVTTLCCVLLSAARIAAQEPQAVPPSQPAAATPEDYVLQSGDEITVRVFNHPELEDTVQIRPDGKISLVLVDDLPIAGLTARDVDLKLTEAYSRLYRDVQLAVIVRKFVNQKIYVGGEVGAPGFQPISGRATALTAVLQAGGFRGTARPESVILLRNQGGKPEVVRMDLKAVLERGAPDVALQPFDVVYVPMSKIAKVDKFVDQYIRQLIPVGTNLGFTYLLGGTAVIPQ
jgi:protein involved in polysaccharide export with SLBB domain